MWNWKLIYIIFGWQQKPLWALSNGPRIQTDSDKCRNDSKSTQSTSTKRSTKNYTRKIRSTNTKRRITRESGCSTQRCGYQSEEGQAQSTSADGTNISLECIKRIDDIKKKKIKIKIILLCSVGMVDCIQKYSIVSTQKVM